MSRKIIFFTGTRAEYGLLRSLMLELQNTANIDISLLVSGTHLESQHGNTIEEIHKDAMPIGATVALDLNQQAHVSPQVAICASMGRAVEKYSQALYELKPDILIVLGDRYEAFCCATAATMLNIPIAHLHGGEQTLGAVDETLRHSMTKMSHVHFTSCEEHRQRVIQLGEQPNTVWNVGALGVENALNVPLLSEAVLRKDISIAENQPYFLCTFHPVTLEPGQEVQQWQEVQKALDCFPQHAVIVTGANADPGGNAVNTLLSQWAEKEAHRVRFYSSLGVLRYLSAAKYASCVVGNSSSGILEIPSLATPVVNIGNRQKGRCCSKAVLHCETTADAIVQALHTSQSAEHRDVVQGTPNPYNGKDVAASMAHILASIPLIGITQKTFFDMAR